MPVEFHFIVLQHGYHGTEKDMEYLDKLLQENIQNKPQQTQYTFVLNSNVNHGLRTDQGVLPCSRRLSEYVLSNVEERVRQYTYQKIELDQPEGKEVELTVRLSFVAHSMGGLMVRAALPPLLRGLYAAYHNNPEAPSVRMAAEPVGVKLDTLCCIAVPHLGVAHMPSQFKAGVGRGIGRLFSQGLYDMYLDSPVVTEELLQPQYTQYLSQFQRRVLINATNDCTVMGYSSCFCIDAAQLAILTSQGKAPSASTVEEDHLPLPSTSLEGMRRGGFKLRELAQLEELWPTGVLPKERGMAERLLPSLLPAEIYTVDLEKSASEFLSKRIDLSVLVAKKISMAVRNFAHRALTCKAPGHYPDVFGYVSEFVQKDVLGVAAGKKLEGN